MLLDADLNACITLPQTFQQSARAGVTRPIINQDQLPIFVSLRNDRFDCGRQKFVIRIKRWRQNRKERPIRKGSRLLTQISTASSAETRCRANQRPYSSCSVASGRCRRRNNRNGAERIFATALQALRRNRRCSSRSTCKSCFTSFRRNNSSSSRAICASAARNSSPFMGTVY